MTLTADDRQNPGRTLAQQGLFSGPVLPDR